MVARYAMQLKPALYAVGVIIMILAYSGCGGTTTTTTQPQGPITIGISLSLSGDFSADGKYFQQGYQLWADTVNAKRIKK